MSEVFHFIIESDVVEKELEALGMQEWREFVQNLERWRMYGGDPYNDLLSPSTTVNDAEENTATLKSLAQSASPCNRPKPGKGKLRMRVPPGMGSPVFMPEKIKPNYPYSAPIGVSEDEANKIRNNVLKKSVAQSPSPRHRRKSFSSNNYLKYGRKRESVQDNRSTNNIHPYNDSLSSSTTVNDAGENPATLYIESAA
ncbi:Golgi-associated plant pathogenesis-related protein 1 [Aphis craccivora]|uniref:Golgi-associated plant pathogenesis-related protein 1 n=1 Tax=Aphis craccivora TaxID=307492 RepID=A0A6G0YG23_APHCR|nr:Golgi-associated plant pathogenesis-related protein 1 [Aphis craccivora]